MTHATNDELLLLAYGEVPREIAAPIEAHVASCADCRRELLSLDTARAALDVAVTARRSRDWLPWIVAAAVLAAVLLLSPGGPPKSEEWPGHREWSVHAGYFAGGRAVIEIDSQLTRLEQGWPYGQP
ncbi:MAG TPA: hypothetical protein VG454_16540 [Gemmatimonadales bacterium]|nr:hypothetical protein [Gemmatimonadales bacterium]